MSYHNHFERADEYITHLDDILTPDPEIQAKFAGVVAVIAVMAYEAAIRDILVEFARNQNSIFGRFAANRFARFAGDGIEIPGIKGHLTSFGEEYKTNFSKHLAEEDEAVEAYKNLVLWRNKFAHGRYPPEHATYKEGKEFYRQGTKIIDALAQVMRVYPGDDTPTKSE